MWQFLANIKISTELGAFVVLSVFFILIGYRVLTYMISQFDRRLAEQGNIMQHIADEFQSQAEQFRVQVNEMDKRNYDRHVHYQDQFETLVDSYVKVSKESVHALSKIESAFLAQSSRLENLEREIRGRQLPPPSPSPGGSPPFSPSS